MHLLFSENREIKAFFVYFLHCVAGKMLYNDNKHIMLKQMPALGRHWKEMEERI